MWSNPQETKDFGHIYWRNPDGYTKVYEIIFPDK